MGSVTRPPSYAARPRWTLRSGPTNEAPLTTPLQAFFRQVVPTFLKDLMEAGAHNARILALDVEVTELLAWRWVLASLCLGIADLAEERFYFARAPKVGDEPFRFLVSNPALKALF